MTAARRAARGVGAPAQSTEGKPLSLRAAAAEREFTLAHLQMRRAQAAEWIETLGEWVLPLFERLDEECEKLERRSTALDRARALAASRR